MLSDDIDDARVFGGIHFRFDQVAGAIQSRQVGACTRRRRTFGLFIGGNTLPGSSATG